MVGINIYHGWYQQLAMDLVVIFMIIPLTLYWQCKRKYLAARLISTIANLSIITLSTYISLHDYQANKGAEILIIGYLPIVIILFDRKIRYAFVFIMLICFLFLKLLVQHYADQGMHYYPVVICINYISVFCTVYLFTDFFRRQLGASMTTSERYNQLLKEKSEDLENQNTILKKQSEIIRESEIVLRALIDNSPMFLGMIDQFGYYKAVNQRFEDALGIPISEIEGKHYRDILPQSVVEKQEPYIIDGLKGINRSFEEWDDLPDGRRICTFGNYRTVKNDAGKIVGLSVFIIDITEQKEREQELKILNRTKDTLLSIISHDLRSPISSLEALLGLFSKGHVKESDFMIYIDKLQKRVSGLSLALDNVLNWSKTQLQGFVVNPIKVSVIDIFHEINSIYTDIAKQKEIVIQIEIDDDLYVWVDQDHLRLVLRNLLNNAIKYTDEQGEIRMIARMEADSAAIAVSDSGIGMDHEQMEQLLSQTANVGSLPGTAGEKGTGIGLQLCRDVLERNGSALMIESLRGKGSTFRFLLPLHKSTPIAT